MEQQPHFAAPFRSLYVHAYSTRCDIFWLAGVIFSKLSANWQFFIAVSAEAAWEVFENSNFIIERYRQNTASVDYFGDSILNSVGDLLGCAVGFWIAFQLGWRLSLVFFSRSKSHCFYGYATVYY